MKRGDTPFVDSILMETNAKIGLPVKITIMGNWPTPNWFYKETIIEWNVTESYVTIGIIGNKSSGIALQMLQPMSSVVEIKFPSPGSWLVKILGKSGNLDKSILIS